MSTIPEDVREILATVASDLRGGPQADEVCSHADVMTRIAVEANRRTHYPLATTHVAGRLLPDMPADITCAEFADLITERLDEDQDDEQDEQGGAR